MLDLAEEAVIVDPLGTHRRRLVDGSVVDLSSYDSDGVILVFVDERPGTPLFIDFAIE